MEIKNNSHMRKEIKKLIDRKKEMDMITSFLIDQVHEHKANMNVQVTDEFINECKKHLPHFQNPGPLVAKAAVGSGTWTTHPLMRTYMPLYLMKVLTLTDPHALLENPYLKYIQTLETKVGDYHLQMVSYEPMTIILDQEPALEDLGIAPHFILLEDQFSFPILTRHEKLVGAITPFEINAYQKMIEKSSGEVIIYGLKLGYLSYMVHLKNEVSHITVIEEHEEVIDIFYKQILPQFDHPEKVTVMKGRYQDYPQIHGDCVFFDQYRDQHDGMIFYLTSPHPQGNYYLERSILEQIRRLMMYYLEEWLNHQGRVDDVLFEREVYAFFKTIKIKDQKSLYRLFDINYLKKEIEKRK